MGIPIWCLIAHSFLITVTTGLHDDGGNLFYEALPSPSPTPQFTQSIQPDQIGMKEIVLFLTPDQVEVLQAAGAVVHPYPEYENDYLELQQQFQTFVGPLNNRQYQPLINPVDYRNDNSEVHNYYKFLNIQEINDEIAQPTKATETTTEKPTTTTTTTPKYKYSKARQQYKAKELSTPYVPKKKGRPKTSNQNNNVEYVRFLPNYEHQILQMTPYRAVPLAAYHFGDNPLNLYIQDMVEARLKELSKANTPAQHNIFGIENRLAQPNIVDIDAQLNAYSQKNTGFDQNEFSQALAIAQQNGLIQLNTESYRDVYIPTNNETLQNVFPQANTLSQQNINSRVDTEPKQNVFSQANTVPEPKVFSQANTVSQQYTNSRFNAKPQQNLNSQANIAPQTNVVSQGNTESQQNIFSNGYTVPQENVFLQGNAAPQQIQVSQTKTEPQQNVFPEANTVPQQNVFSQTSPTPEYVFIRVHTEAQLNENSQGTTESQRNAYFEANATQQNILAQANTNAQRNTYSQDSIKSQNFSQAGTQIEENVYYLKTTANQKKAYYQDTIKGKQNTFSEVKNETNQNAYTETNTETSSTAYTIAQTELQPNELTQKVVSSQQNENLNRAQQTERTVENTETRQNVYSQTYTAAPQTQNTVASRITSQTVSATPNTKAPETTSIVTSTTQATSRSQQNIYSRGNKGNHRNLFRRPNRIHINRGSKRHHGLEKGTVSVATQKPTTNKTYLISKDKKEFKETLSSVEGLPPLTPVEQPLAKLVTKAPSAPTVKAPTLHQDQLSLLLAPLYQHQTITESISRQKEELLKSELDIRNKLQKMKDSQHYNQQAYNAELEKLTRNFGEQNALAKIEATGVSNTPTVFVNRVSQTTENNPEELEKKSKLPMLVRIPTPQDGSFLATYPVSLEHMQSQVPKLEERRKNSADSLKNKFAKLERPYTVLRFPPFTEKQAIPVAIPMNPDQITIIRHIWEH